jgi:integrase
MRREPRLRWQRSSRRGFVRVHPFPPKYFKGEWPSPGPPRVKAPRPIYEQYLQWLDLWRADQLAAYGPAGLDPVTAPTTARLRFPCLSEVWAAYDRRNLVYYRKGGKVTSEVGVIRTACRIVDRLFGTLPAARFGPQELLKVRAEMVRLGWCRSSINTQVGRVRSMFKWAGRVEQGPLVPMSVYHTLREIEPLKRGRCNVPEAPRVRPVAWELIERTLPILGPVVRNIVRVHWLLGCRSQDVLKMRPCDLVTDAPCPACAGVLPKRQRCAACACRGWVELAVWLYYPEGYKTQHHDHLAALRYRIGPRGQEILRPLLDACPDRDSWVFPCKPIWGGTGRYSTNGYRYHITRLIDKAGRERPELGLERWSPRQIRHARLTEIRALHGVEVAQEWAQHQSLSTTEIYAEADERKLQCVALEMG